MALMFQVSLARSRSRGVSFPAEHWAIMSQLGNWRLGKRCVHCVCGEIFYRRGIIADSTLDVIQLVEGRDKLVSLHALVVQWPRYFSLSLYTTRTRTLPQIREEMLFCFPRGNFHKPSCFSAIFILKSPEFNYNNNNNILSDIKNIGKLD